MDDQSVEEEKDESPEARKRRFMTKWDKVIEQDVEAMAQRDSTQRPLSRAYLSLCPANRASNKQVQEERATHVDYLAKGQKENFKENNVRQVLRGALTKAGFPSAKVDEVMSNVEALPDSLVSAYYNMVREEIRERLRVDDDFKERRSSYPNLDKL